MPADSDTYDFIVTGAGSAGCAVAGRLAESRLYRVLLLEAGPPDKNPWIHIPLGYAKTYVDPAVNWMFETEPQPQMKNRRLYLPRGKTLGGSSSINGMLYVRGHHADYDEWRQRGCTGWDWDSVLPYFKKAENQARGADAFHGTGGPLHVSDQTEKGELSKAVLEACVQAGIPPNPDFNGARQEGCGYYQTTTNNKRRWSAAKAYLSNPPPNLTIQTNAHATRVVIENGRATGVEYQTAGGRRVSRASREVIVSGGAYGSPQLLLLSGLGPAQHLQDMDIEVIRDMPAVGSNLHDHFNTTASWRCSKAITLNDLQNSTLRKMLAGVRYGLFRSGPMASNGITAGVFTRSDPRLERPDIQINLFEWSTKERSRDAVIPHDFPGFTMSPVHLRPEGRGTVRLGSPDPFAWPAVLFDYLRTDYDIQAALFGIRLVRKIAAQPALQPYVVNELSPGSELTTDDDLLDFIRRTGVSNQHPTSSCAMGNGPNTVVDPRLKVHGIAGLRVADASIMPVVVGGNTNAPTIMIGEKAAAMILEDTRAGAPSLAA
ncbi:GMC family oxidoreductase [Acidisphaera sp. S103]|uniref:GMC family oxidoreductase n=1 Tax=Acidisphaera sp. S103 TaxID=1747223 RepID=UPI00131AF469|nr:GMC family oxidoreductase N-terminal domain-containing protein [Acidisphaera sp. S103]